MAPAPGSGEEPLSLVASIAANSSGYLFVGTYPISGAGRVRIITPSGSLTSIKNSDGTPFPFTQGDDYDQGVFAMAVAPDGDLLIGSLTQMFEFDAASPFIPPPPPRMVLDGFKGLYGIAAHPDGRVFLADSGNNKLFVAKENPQDDTWSKEVFAGSGATYEPGDRNVFDGAGTAATFDQPSGLALDAARGVLYVSDSAANLVRVVDLATKMVITLAGDAATTRVHTTLPGPSAGFSDGVGTAVRLQAPLGLTLDAVGNLFIVDELGTNPNLPNKEGGGVRLLSGKDVYTVAGSPDHGTVNGPGDIARFNYPTSIATLPVASFGKPAGTMLILDGWPIRKRAWHRFPPQPPAALPAPPPHHHHAPSPLPPSSPLPSFPNTVRTISCTGMPVPPAPPAPPSSNTALAAPVATILLSTGFGLLALAAAVGALVAWKTGALCFAPKGTGAPQAALRAPGTPNAAAWGEGANVSPNPLASLNTV